MTGPRWQMVPVPSLVINVVITTSLLLLKVISNVLANFLILLDILPFKYFSLYGYFEVNWNSENAMNSTI